MKSFAEIQDRVQREKDIHNQWASSVDISQLLVSQSFESPTAIENRYILEEFGDLKGKKILDVGCGAGEAAIYFALQGAKVIGVDISVKFLELANKLAKTKNVSVQTFVSEVGKLPFADDSFDLIFGHGVLHHVDLESAAKEIRRVLRPGGKAAFVEPLPYNPIINIYRVIAREVRTEDERPLSFRQLSRFGAEFASYKKRYFWLFSLYIFFHFFVIRRWNPNKVRYWKRVIEVGPEYKHLVSFLQKIDRFALKYLPFLRPLCWNVVLVVQ